MVETNLAAVLSALTVLPYLAPAQRAGSKTQSA